MKENTGLFISVNVNGTKDMFYTCLVLCFLLTLHEYGNFISEIYAFPCNELSWFINFGGWYI